MSFILAARVHLHIRVYNIQAEIIDFLEQNGFVLNGRNIQKTDTIEFHLEEQVHTLFSFDFCKSVIFF